MPMIWMANRSILVPLITVRPYPVIPGLTCASGRIGGASVGAAWPDDGIAPRVIIRTASVPKAFRTCSASLDHRSSRGVRNPSIKKDEGDESPSESHNAIPSRGLNHGHHIPDIHTISRPHHDLDYLAVHGCDRRGNRRPRARAAQKDQ